MKNFLALQLTVTLLLKNIWVLKEKEFKITCCYEMCKFTGTEKRHLIFKAFVISQFNYRPLKFAIFKPLSYCFEETIGFNVKVSFASRLLSRQIRWYIKRILRKGYSVPRDFSWIENYKLFSVDVPYKTTKQSNQ